MPFVSVCLISLVPSLDSAICRLLSGFRWSFPSEIFCPLLVLVQRFQHLVFSFCCAGHDFSAWNYFGKTTLPLPWKLVLTLRPLHCEYLYFSILHRTLIPTRDEITTTECYSNISTSIYKLQSPSNIHLRLVQSFLQGRCLPSSCGVGYCFILSFPPLRRSSLSVHFQFPLHFLSSLHCVILFLCAIPMFHH